MAQRICPICSQIFDSTKMSCGHFNCENCVIAQLTQPMCSISKCRMAFEMHIHCTTCKTLVQPFDESMSPFPFDINNNDVTVDEHDEDGDDEYRPTDEDDDEKENVSP